MCVLLTKYIFIFYFFYFNILTKTRVFDVLGSKK